MVVVEYLLWNISCQFFVQTTLQCLSDQSITSSTVMFWKNLGGGYVTFSPVLQLFGRVCLLGYLFQNSWHRKSTLFSEFMWVFVLQFEKRLGSGSLYRKIISPKIFDRTPFDPKSIPTLFDQNTIRPNTVWPNAIWPKVHLTDLTAVWPNAVWPKVHFSERSYDRFFFQKMVIWPNLLLTKNVIWLKKNGQEGRFTESSFDWKLFLKVVISSEA
jgi:hypothetical protein